MLIKQFRLMGVMYLGLGVVLLGVAPSYGGEGWTRITTADGRGGDTTIVSGGSSEDSDAQVELGLHQNSPKADLGQKIYLRFDVSALRGRQVESVHLTLQPISGYDDRYDFNIFGVHEAVDAAVVLNGVMAVADETLTWANAPGHDPGNPGGVFEVRDVREFEEVSQELPNGEVRSVNQPVGIRQEVVNNGGGDYSETVYLGKISIRPGNNRSRLIGGPIVSFLNADQDGLVTMIVTLATPAEQPIKFASGEHPLFDPPSLWVTHKAKDASVGITELTAFKLSSNQTIASAYHALDIRAAQRGWVECVDDAGKLFEELSRRYSQDELVSRSRLAVSLADLMRIETAFKSQELLEDEWADQIVQTINQHPASADDLIHAFYILAGTRVGESPGRAISVLDLRPLLDYELTPLARNTVIEIAADVIDGPGPGVDKQLVHYKKLIPVAYGEPTTPHIVYQYVLALREAAGADAVSSFLENVAALRPNEPIGQAASILRVSFEADSARKADLVTRLVESNSGEVVKALMPYYLTNQSQNGQLLRALIAIDSSLGEQPSGEYEVWGQSVVDRIFEIMSSDSKITLFSKADLEQLDLGEQMNSSVLCARLANQLYEEGEYLKSASISFGLIQRENYFLPGLNMEFSPKLFNEFGDIDSVADRQVLAALMLSVVYKHQYEQTLSKRFLNKASSVSPVGQVRVHLFVYQALDMVQRGELNAAELLLAEALSLSPDSSTLLMLQDLVSTAGKSLNKDDNPRVSQ